MSLISLNQNCCQPCANLMRAVQGQFSFPGYDGGDMASMNEWVMGYDMTTIPWNTGIVGYFSAVGQTTPGSTGTVVCSEGNCFAANTTYLIGTSDSGATPCPANPSGGSTVTRAQYLLPLGQDYFVVATGQNISDPEFPDCSPAYYLSVGCYKTGTGLPTIVELPIVTQTQSADPNCLWADYYLGVVDPGVTSVPNILDFGEVIPIIPSLSALNTSNQGFGHFGSAWAGSITTECSDSPNDPFLGSDPP